MHGFALNCTVDLRAFDATIPCGISDAEMTSLTVELSRAVSVVEAATLTQRHLSRLLDWRHLPEADADASPALDLGMSRRCYGYSAR